MHPNGLAAYWQRSIEWMRQKHYSERTLEGKREKMNYFLQWCEERAISSPQEVTRPMLERYQQHLFLYRKNDGKPLAIRTQWMRLVEVRLFFRWLSRQNVILYNPAADWELMKPGKALPKDILTVSEVERVMAIPDVSTPNGIRHRAILEVLYSTGLRRQEVANLKIMDIRDERGVVMVRQGKGGKDRVVPISERALAWIDKYREEVRPSLPKDEGFLFLRNNGRPHLARHLSDMVRDVVDATKLEKRGSCHMFRHSMATQMLEDGADIRYVQAMLGHESLESTQIYTQVSIRKLKEVHSKTHPGRKLSEDEEPALEESSGEAVE